MTSSRCISLCLSYEMASRFLVVWCFFFQAEDGIRDLVRSRGLGDVYKRQGRVNGDVRPHNRSTHDFANKPHRFATLEEQHVWTCLLYTSDAADERSSVDLGGRRIIKKKT